MDNLSKPIVTRQMQAWKGEFGRVYTDRNSLSLRELDSMYEERYGVSRIAMNERFLSELDPSIRILEVGSNIGNQLALLQGMGFRNLTGLELQEYALNLARQRTENIHFIQGSALAIPQADAIFDLVFTSGVLIHISPQHLGWALSEIHRVTRRFIWGFEYFHSRHLSVPYRGCEELLWKGDFARMYRDRFDDLRLVVEERFEYISDDNVDSMFLLEKV